MLDPSGPCTPIQKNSHAVNVQSSSALFLGFPLTNLRQLFAFASMAPKKQPSKRPSSSKAPGASQSTTPPKTNPYQAPPSFTPLNRATAAPAFPIPYRQQATPSTSSMASGTVPYSQAQWLSAGQASTVPAAPIVSPLQMAGPIRQETGTGTTFPWQRTKLCTVGDCYAELGLNIDEGNDLTFEVRTSGSSIDF
jgi:hypothetical protein